MMNKNDLLKIYEHYQFNKIDYLFVENGLDDLDYSGSTWSRDFYKKHLEFFEAGSTYKERLFLAGNRIGKTMAGAFEVVLHCTGIYPDWWKGKRYSSPRSWWVVAESSEMSVKSVQKILLGNIDSPGTGLIPKHLIDFSTLPTVTKIGGGRPGVRIKHISGGYSSIDFKEIQQGQKSFTSATVSIWVDEILTKPIYEEVQTRITMDDNIFIHTFTPILGYSDQLQSFFGNEGYRVGKINDFKYCVSATLWDVPHIPELERQRLVESWAPYVREARSKGIPQLGEGQVFPYSEEMISIDAFPIPKHWKRLAGMDVGWRAWAVCWFAINPDDNKIYCYSTYKAGEKTPLEHWTTLKTRGETIPFAADPASHGRQQTDGAIIFDQLQDFGMSIQNANNQREAGIYDIAELFIAGQLKIFSTERDLISEILNLSRDKNGKIKDSSSKHLFDSFRYGVHTREIAKNDLETGKLNPLNPGRVW